MTDRCCNTPIVKHYSLVDKKIKQPMNEFYLSFLSTGKFSFRVFFFFFFSCLIEEKGLSLISYLSLITHGNEQQQ
jgi:hypothetical protein